MEIEIWLAQQPSFFNLKKKRNRYEGPYPTFSFAIDNSDLIFLASNNKISIINVNQKHMEYMYKVKDKILDVKYTTQLILIQTKATLQLLNFRLQLVKYLQLNKQQILSIYKDQNCFRIIYNGYHLKSQRFLKFKNIPIIDKKSIYIRDIRFYIFKNNLYYEKSECNPTLLKIDQKINLQEVEVYGMDCNTFCLVQIRDICVIYLHIQSEKVIIMKKEDKNLLVIRNYLIQSNDQWFKIKKIQQKQVINMGRIPISQLEDLIQLNGDLYQIQKKVYQNKQSRIISKTEPEPEEIQLSLNIQNNQPQNNQNQLIDLINSHFPQRNHVRRLSNIAQEIDESSQLSPVKTYQKINDFDSIEHNMSSMSNIQNHFDFRRMCSLPSEIKQQDLWLQKKQIMAKQQKIKILRQQGQQKNKQIIIKLLLIKNINISQQQFINIQNSDPLVIIKNYLKQNQQILDVIYNFIDKILRTQQNIADQIMSKINSQNILQQLNKIQTYASDKIIFKKWCQKYLKNQLLRNTSQKLMIHPLKEQQINVLLTLHPNIKNSELQQPQELYANILKLYFSGSNLNQTILIQDQPIYISNPRNLLNVLLYLSQLLQHEPVIAIKIYLKILINEGLIETVINIIYQQNVLQICNLPFQIFIDIIKQIERELYHRQVFLKNEFYIILNLIRDQQNQYRIIALSRLELIELLEKSDIIYSSQQIYDFSTNSNGFQFLTKIIREEDITCICNINFQLMYQKIWIMDKKSPRKLEYYTNQLLQLTEEVIFRCIQGGLYCEAYEYMIKIKLKLKPSLIIYSIISYLANNSKINLVKNYLNQFCSSDINQLFSIYTMLIFKHQDIFSGINSMVDENHGDFKCNFQIMQRYAEQFKIYEENNFLLKQDFLYLVYKNLELVYNLADYFPFIQLQHIKGFAKFMIDCNYYEKSLFKLHSANTHSKSQIQDLPLVYKQPILEKWIPDNHQKKKIKNYMDIAGSNPQMKIIKRKSQQYKTEGQVAGSLHSSRSQKKMASFQQRRFSFSHAQQQKSFDELRNLINNKDQDSVKQFLKQYYYQNSIDVFNSLVEKCKLPFEFYRLQILEEFEQYKLMIDIKKIFSFEFILEKEDKEAFKTIRKNIEYEINIKNFWVLIYLIQKILDTKYKNKVGIIYLKKEINEISSESNLKQIQQRFCLILDEFNLSKKKLQNLYELVKQNTDLNQLTEIILNKINTL